MDHSIEGRWINPQVHVSRQLVFSRSGFSAIILAILARSLLAGRSGHKLPLTDTASEG